uniref:ABC transmembrane type-2 domain-containing protein n=1 Tax=Cliftonaea pectinata TaxID=2007206 RepID=A0A1Z1MPL7_9FLOR|nr:hypothetical protein [Cliftonaea pectinata]ARW68033.1 hypothetical protein [Cliftonaea pectinata]
MFSKNKKKFFSLKPNTRINKKIIKDKIYKEIYVLTKRLYIQAYRRPSHILASLIQPLLWLILFGALFQNAPIELFGNYKIRYEQFLNPGIMTFTAFNSSISAGLPIIFDREFGFLNRILTSPITYKSNLCISSTIYTWTIVVLQIATIITFNKYSVQNNITTSKVLNIIGIITLLTINISNISIFSALILPGHIEFIALSFIMNLPILFSSTALAPLSFMPYWLQILSCTNPLTYAIEIIRYTIQNKHFSLHKKIIETIWFNLQINESIFILILINIISLILVYNIITYKYD